MNDRIKAKSSLALGRKDDMNYKMKWSSNILKVGREREEVEVEGEDREE